MLMMAMAGQLAFWELLPQLVHLVKLCGLVLIIMSFDIVLYLI